MKDRFDELAKVMAGSPTRRTALKKLTLGLAGLALAAVGKASAQKPTICVEWICTNNIDGGGPVYVCGHGKPYQAKFGTCTKIGIAPCNYCMNCC